VLADPRGQLQLDRHQGHLSHPGRESLWQALGSIGFPCHTYGKGGTHSQDFRGGVVMNATCDIYNATTGLFLGYATLDVGPDMLEMPTSAWAALSEKDIARLELVPDSRIEVRPGRRWTLPTDTEPPRLMIEILLGMTCIHRSHLLYEALDYIGQPDDGSLSGYRFDYIVQMRHAEQIKTELQELFNFQLGLKDSDRSLVDWLRLVGAVRLVGELELDVNMLGLELALQ
jgi:hypothetical protein